MLEGKCYVMVGQASRYYYHQIKLELIDMKSNPKVWMHLQDHNACLYVFNDMQMYF